MTPFFPSKAAVIGAGTMGAQIAAHLANVGLPVLLLDVVPTELTPDEQARGLTLASPAVRNRPVRALFERMKKLSPPPFFTPETAGLVTLGNVEDNLADIATADWVVEAVLERMDLKQALHAKIAARARPDALVTTNTSGLPIQRMVAGLPLEYRRRFFAAHFFNPPRYMRLLELVPTPDTDPDRLRAFAAFAEAVLGKGVVVAKDTPCFIGNRIGCYDLQTVLWLAQTEGLTVDEVDALTGPLIGRPSSATFRLFDLVGIDLMAQLGRNLQELLSDPAEKAIFAAPSFIGEMLQRGWWGEKKGQGFYRRVQTEKGREIQVLDLRTLDYRPPQPPAWAELAAVAKIPDLGARLRDLCALDGPAGRFVWKHLSAVLCYTADRIPEIADDVATVDNALKWGFNWQLGPFEIWDALGVAAVARRLETEGRRVPALVASLLAGGRASFYRRQDGKLFHYAVGRRDDVESRPAPKAIALSQRRETGGIVRENAAASLLDLGDGVACLEFRTKMNVIGEETLGLLQDALAAVRRNFAGLVIGNQGPHFSAGANLKEFAALIEAGRWDELDRMLRRFLEATSTLRRFEKPVVAAVHGYTLGGGCEFALGCDHVVAAAETSMGLPEAGVGLIPGAHGTKEMLVRCTDGVLRNDDPDYLAGVRLAWETIFQAKISTSAAGAEKLRYLRPGEWTPVFNRDWLIGEAKAKVLQLADGYRPRPPRTDIPAVGQTGLALFKSGLHTQRMAGQISEHDQTVGLKLAHVLCGGDLSSLHFVPESYILELEHAAFLSLCGEAKTLERIRHTLKTGKPLKN
ncbi:MAG: 3-hydroxyacyl-CoA dehydrogenase/enoyl-CoA hydratase family protein [Opitutaceae bacterium]|nr:3-hydroxyacyl-CoA dehydrogenase/enoyl-CoA hydratase family protein [Opitutaceae bacterium]